MPTTDVELMHLVADGDRDAFAELVERHHRAVINFFYRKAWDRDLSEDLAQEVFVKLYRTAPRYRASAKFTTFLYRIATNHWIDHCRSSAARRRPLSLDAAMDDDDHSFAGGLEGREVGPVEHLSRRELMGRIRRAIALLSPEQQDVFLLAEMQGMRYAEIADVLDIPVGTVKSRMHTAVHHLREALAEELQEEYDDEI